ncbi:hypothetical protein IAR55_006547 [Kwoniella newhampshirensis]|uniref:Nucleoporin p58/p45 n=1 Tax=Kwoniella newhampshirensis TaxID=1651941 RepID=A0AAW0YUD8_9TREE
MSFGGFKFGAAPSTQPAAPSLSVTNPTPSGTPGSTPAPFSFGSTSTSTSQPAAGSATGGSLFGGFGQNQSQGGQAQQPAQNPNSGSSLFGGFGAKAATAPASGGGLFGSVGTGQQQQPQQPGGSGLFGSTSQSQQQPQQQSGGTGLFGSTTNQQQPANTGLFGSTSQQPQQQSGGLFGSTVQQQQQQPSTSLFGGQSTTQPASSSLFGQTAQPSQNQGQGTLQTSTNGASSSGGVGKNTRFADLPEGAQKYIEQMDNVIKQQKVAGSGMNIEGLGRAIWQTSLDIKAANEEYSAISHTLKSLGASLTQLREKMINEGRDIERVKEIWDAYRSAEGRMGQVRLGAYREFPQEFFGRIASGMEERVGRYKRTIAQLNRAIASLSSDSHTPSPQAIAQTIQNHQQAMLQLAAQLDGLQLRMNDLRAAYAEEWRDKTGSVRDPFEVAREEKAIKV